MSITNAQVIERFLQGGNPCKTGGGLLEYRTDGLGQFLWSQGGQVASRYGTYMWYISHHYMPYTGKAHIRALEAKLQGLGLTIRELRRWPSEARLQDSCFSQLLMKWPPEEAVPYPQAVSNAVWAVNELLDRAAASPGTCTGTTATTTAIWAENLDADE